MGTVTGLSLHHCIDTHMHHLFKGIVKSIVDLTIDWPTGNLCYFSDLSMLLSWYFEMLFRFNGKSKHCNNHMIESGSTNEYINLNHYIEKRMLPL